LEEKEKREIVKKLKEEKEVLDLFNLTKVEPFNFTRQALNEEDCLSYL
jgi:hypothetical protein